MAKDIDLQKTAQERREYNDKVLEEIYTTLVCIKTNKTSTDLRC